MRLKQSQETEVPGDDTSTYTKEDLIVAAKDGFDEFVSSAELNRGESTMEMKATVERL